MIYNTRIITYNKKSTYKTGREYYPISNLIKLIKNKGKKVKFKFKQEPTVDYTCELGDFKKVNIMNNLQQGSWWITQVNSAIIVNTNELIPYKALLLYSDTQKGRLYNIERNHELISIIKDGIKK